MTTTQPELTAEILNGARLYHECVHADLSSLAAAKAAYHAWADAWPNLAKGAQRIQNAAWGESHQ